MSALAKLKARLEQQAPSVGLTKPTKPPSVSFDGTDPAPFLNNRVLESANDSIKPTAEVLRQFRFDLVEANIEAGYPALDIDRVNNAAWYHMQTDGLSFEYAIRKAAAHVVDCDITPAERAYADVRSLWRRIASKDVGS